MNENLSLKQITNTLILRQNHPNHIKVHTVSQFKVIVNGDCYR